MFNKLVVAVDGSENSYRAVDYARELGAKFDSRIILMHAYPHTSDMRAYDVYDRLLGERKYAGQQVLNHARERLANVTVEVEEDLLEDPAAEAILAVAEARRADLILMGTRGRGTLKGLMLGSVSAKVSHHAPCAVMIIR